MTKNDQLARGVERSGIDHLTMGVALLMIGQGIILANQVDSNVPFVLNAGVSTVLLLTGLSVIATRTLEGIRGVLA